MMSNIKTRLYFSGPVNDERSRNGLSNSIFPKKKNSWEEEQKKKKKERKEKHKKYKKDGNQKRRKRYEWRMVGFTSCSETCGGGEFLSFSYLT